MTRWTVRLYRYGWGVARPIADQPGLWEYYHAPGALRAACFRRPERAEKVANFLNGEGHP